MSNIIENTIQSIKPLDKQAMALAAARQDALTKPRGSLGRLEELSIQLAGIQGQPRPRIKQKAVIIMVADHGVVAEGTSAYPQEVTTQMVLNFVHGGAAINVISRQMDARVIVVDIGMAADASAFPGIIHHKMASGTLNMCQGSAMTLKQAVQSIEVGIEVVKAEIGRGLDIVCTGEMGIGNTTASSAICSVMTRRTVAEVTGRGTGINDRQLKHKIKVINQALALNKPDAGKPMEVLAKVGGLEIGGLTGVILGAAANQVPVMIDGFISGAAALIACGLCPQCKDYLVASHASVETGHRYLLQHLELKPLVDMNMRVGEGTGAALCLSLAEAACRTLDEMATFEEAGVSDMEG